MLSVDKNGPGEPSSRAVRVFYTVDGHDYVAASTTEVVVRPRCIR